jgi:hypothetical protein
MSLLAESLVEEWLNRQGFFTIRGVKHGVGEMDLLAVRPEQNNRLVGRHVEVQVSVRPIGYIGKLTKEDIADTGKSATSAAKRTPEQVKKCAIAWVEKKFKSKEKVRLRASLWPGVSWTYHLVHGVVREPNELKHFTDCGLTVLPFHEVLESLSLRKKGSFSGSAGGELAEIVGYYDAYTKRRKC